MKLLIKKIAKTEIVILLRNTLKIRPLPMYHKKSKTPLTVSDAFLWRTDSGFKTKFKFADIINIFCKLKNSKIELHFYSNKNKLIKIFPFNDLNLSNEIDINSEFLDGITDFGAFYVYHLIDNNKTIKNDIISNRCYIGYSKNSSLYSFVHGNTLAKYKNISNEKRTHTNIVKTSLLANYSYTIQKFFDNFDKNELIFINPTSKIIRMCIENKNYKLEPGNTIIIETQSKILTIKSNCLFLRPTVFSYKNSFVDIHHS